MRQFPRHDVYSIDASETCNLETLEPRILLSATWQDFYESFFNNFSFSQFQGPEQNVPQNNPDDTPVVEWSTYLGGSGDDRGYAIATDSQNNIIAVGYANSREFVNDDRIGNKDVFVAKFANDGQLIWSSLYGGKKKDVAYGVAVDGNDNIVVTGYTDSADWTSGGFDTDYDKKKDAFVLKINTDGQEIWSTYVGGDREDYAYDVAIDSNNDIIIAGATRSKDLTDNKNPGDYDIFTAKISEDGQLVWLTSEGDKKKDYAYGVAVDSADNVIVTGYTDSEDWIQGGFDTSYNKGKDAFVVKYDLNGKALWSTYVGSKKEDRAYDVAIDSQDNILITGYTKSDDLPNIVDGTVHEKDAKDAFVSKLDADGDIIWSTYVGGSEEDKGQAITIDSDDNALITGYTKSADIFEQDNDDNDWWHDDDDDDDRWRDDGDDDDDDDDDYKTDKNAFVASINSDGQQNWGTLLEGGSEEDKAQGIAVDHDNNPVVIGYTKSDNFAQGGFDTTFNGDKDAFVAKFGPDVEPPKYPDIDVERPGQPDNVQAYTFDTVILGQSATTTFTIRNEGDATLKVYNTIGLASPFTINPTNAADNNNDDWIVEPGDTVDFQITFNPDQVGQFSDQLILVSNDPDEINYTIDLNATADPVSLTPPEIEVQLQSTDIADGQATPIDFGELTQGDSPTQLTFTINNLGQETLTLGQVQLSSTDFIVIAQPDTSIAGGGTTTFTIQLPTDAVGTKAADVFFTNNDADENPFNFAITGNIVEPVIPENIVSDEFNDTSLDESVWTYSDPRGDTVKTFTGTQLSLEISDLVDHDLWISGDNTASITQLITNEDFSVEVKFDSLLAGEYAMAGFIVRQDPTNFIRFDFYSTNADMNIFAATFANNTPNVEHNVQIDAADSALMRITRTGNTFTQQYSADGTTWIDAAQFDFNLNVTELGLFAGNAGTTPPAHTVLIDYFRTVDDNTPPADDITPPTISNLHTITAPNTITLNADTDEAAALTIELGLDDTYAMPTITTTAATSHSELINSLDPDTTYYLRITATDLAGNTSDPIEITVQTQPDVVTNPDMFVSDEFNDTMLDTDIWQFINPRGDASLVVNGSQLELVVSPGIDHDIWDTGNNAARIMQPTANEDFQLEVKFDSPLAGENAMQGVLVEQDDGNFLRFEFFSDAATTNVFAASFLNGAPKVELNPLAIAPDLPMIMRITRTGDHWLQEYSSDGIAWQTAAEFDYTLNVTKVGTYAANAGSLPGHTTIVDYFRNNTAPITLVSQPIEPASTLEADFNSDGKVSLIDFNILGKNYRRSQWITHSLGDANEDGHVSLFDLEIFSRQYRC